MTSAGPLWWQEPFQMFQTNLREIDASLGVERVLDHIEEFGANAWLLNVGGIIANYPSELSAQTPNPALDERAGGDLVGDAVRAAHARGVRLLARMDFSKVDRRRAEQHPEWCFVSPTGSRQVYNGLTSVCPSAPYYQQQSFAVVEEVLDRYDVDGFFFNWASYNEVDYSGTYWGVCHCQACARAFTAWSTRSGRVGRALPAGPEHPDYPEWQEFAAGTIADLGARMRDLIAARRPEAPLIMGDTSDIVFHEANNQVGRPLWHYRTAEQVSAAKTFRPRKPVLTNAVSFVDMPYRWAGEEPHHMAQHLVQAIARGANPSTYIMGTPDVGRYECLDVAARITRHHRDHRDVYSGLVPAARTLLARPDPLKRGDHRLRTAEFQGLYVALQERHVPFDVLPEHRLAHPDGTAEDRQADVERLGRYAVVVLPDLGPLAPAARDVLDSFTADGGTVVATGSTSFDGDSAQLAGSPAAGRLAVLDTVEATRSMHLRPETADGFPVPVIGAYHVVEPADGADRHMAAMSRAPYGPPEKCYGHLELDHPGYLVGHHGPGTVAVVPWTVGHGYREVGLSAHRDLIVDLLLRVAPSPVAARTDLPDQVDVIAGRSAAGEVVHLINMSGAAPQRFGAPLPIHGARLWLPWLRDGSRVRALVTGVDLPVTGGPDGPTVELPTLELFEVLVVEDGS
ncbi:family 10 glycosylhydrolase [Georgenia halophila]|uniref:Family 10 glycosylhydrolase n=1 Tax=Georgenia halophila TaxID=620889 RepID=A0ABP8LMZ1_9MICO